MEFKKRSEKLVFFKLSLILIIVQLAIRTLSVKCTNIEF